jgi:hypothetical protein
MTVRKLEFTGYKMSSDFTSISVIFDNSRIFSGEIVSESLDTIFTHHIVVPDTDITKMTNAHSDQVIPSITTTHNISVQCTAGEAVIVGVQSSPLHARDIPMVTDPTWFTDTFNDIHVFNNLSHIVDAQHQDSHQDPKYNVSLNKDGVTVEKVLEQDRNHLQGIWHCKVPTDHRLHFDVMVRNLLNFY